MRPDRWSASWSTSRVDLGALFVDLLTAYMAGFIMLLAFTGAVLDRQRTRYGFFVMGAGISLGAFTARYISFRRHKAVRELPLTGHVTV